MNYCHSCYVSYEHSSETTGGLCWECNDKQFFSKYLKTLPEEIKPTVTTDSKEKLEGYASILDKRYLETHIKSKTTLPTDSAERKNYPLFRGLLRYFPAALAGVANTSQKGNDKHNPGKELHHARSKSGDHADCILRHLMDLADLLAAQDRWAKVSDQQILDEANSMAWRSLALSQELHESLGQAPLAPGAKK